jgi:DNA helicase-2/ATP-dependent DNA helicase PcrA
VAITRAKDQLHLIVPHRFYTHRQPSSGDRHVYAQRTRFIPDSTLHHFETFSWPIAKSACGSQTGPKRTPIDVRAKMRRMWG